MSTEMSWNRSLVPWFREDRAGARLAVWFAVALFLTLTCVHFKLGFPRHLIVELIAAKLAFLALIGALGVFHYGVWRQVAERTWEQINNPRWVTFEAEIERDQMRADLAQRGVGVAPTFGDLPTRQRAFQVWNIWKAGRVKEMLEELLPYSRVILTNYVAIAYLLFESSVIDLLSLLLRVAETPLVAAISAGMLLGSFVPAIDVWWRYAGGLGREFTNWERSYREAIPKPPAAS